MPGQVSGLVEFGGSAAELVEELPHLLDAPLRYTKREVMIARMGMDLNPRPRQALAQDGRRAHLVVFALHDHDTRGGGPQPLPDPRVTHEGLERLAKGRPAMRDRGARHRAGRKS